MQTTSPNLQVQAQKASRIYKSFQNPSSSCQCQCQSQKSSQKKSKFCSALLSNFRSLRQSRKMDKLAELRSFSEAGHERLLFPSPLIPADTRVEGSCKRGSCGYEDVEDACRSFENYLVEMIVDEGKVSDLMDVEELLYCWKNLTCPVFIDLVSRFYGELCTDLFSANDDDEKC